MNWVIGMELERYGDGEGGGRVVVVALRMYKGKCNVSINVK